MAGTSRSGNTNDDKRSENSDLINLMMEALVTPIGLLIFTPEPEKLAQRLWHLRNGQLDEFPQLSKLKFHPSPFPEGSLVIVKVQEPEKEDKSVVTAQTIDQLLDV